MHRGTINVPNEVGRDRVPAQPKQYLLLDMPSLDPHIWKICRYPPVIYGEVRPFKEPVNLDTIRDWSIVRTYTDSPVRNVFLRVKESIPAVTSKNAPCLKLRLEEPPSPDLRPGINPARIGDRYIWIHGPNLHPLQFIPMHNAITWMVEEDGHCMMRSTLRKSYATGHIYRNIYNHNVTGNSLLQARISAMLAQVLVDERMVRDQDMLLSERANASEAHLELPTLRKQT